MKAFVKENPLIAFSIALPVLIIGMFAMATWLPTLYVDKPQYDFLFVDDSYNQNREGPVGLEFSVEHARLIARANIPSDDRTARTARLYHFDHQSETVREISVALPANDGTLSHGDKISVPAYENVMLHTTLAAPDGYEYRGQTRSAGLLSEVFGGGRANQAITIAKDGAVVKLNLPTTQYWRANVTFLGWIAKEG